ncbi:MAG: tRNA-dihydrouridine synthase [Thermoleophilia bacterium]|nr:tRNA-dihydrouridine synthase [Thermoleophilia bacterium]
MTVALSEPFAIGKVVIPNRVVLAPMAGFTNTAYRRHMKTHGVGLVYTEMVSAYGLVYHNSRTAAYLAFEQEERPIAVQIFGDTPEILAKAAELVLSRVPRPDLIDLNMACPMRKVVRTGAGGALMGDPDRAVKVARAVAKVAAEFGVPCTAKVRSGLRVGDGLILELAPRLEEAGVAALAVHPRAVEQLYQGEADHRVTAQVVRRVQVPVIASGDLRDAATVRKVFQDTGAAAVMLARGAAGNPWLIEALLGRRDGTRPPLAVIVGDLRVLLGRASAFMGPERAARWIRNLMSWYLRGIPMRSELLPVLRKLDNAKVLDEVLAQIAELGPSSVDNYSGFNL